MADDNKRMFKVSFRSQPDKRETIEQSVSVTIIRKKREKQYKHLQSVPYHKASDVSASTAADCYLQIWELDFFRTRAHGKNLSKNYALYTKAETDLNVRQNRLIVTFPGVVVKDGNAYSFQPDPTFPQDGVCSPLNGKVILKLTPVGQSDPQSYEIPMPEYESVFELGAALRSSRDNAFGNYHNADPHQVHNVEASLRRQIEERGGFAVAFVADYTAAFPSAKQEEFHKQAEEMIATLPTFVLDGNDIKMKYYRISSYKDIKERLSELREAIKNLLEMTESPKVAMLALYGHGQRTRLKIQYNSYNLPGSLRTDRIEDFVAEIKSHLSEHVVIPIFACSTGRGNKPNPDNMYGRAYPCEELGGDSLAWTLLKELQRKGISNPTIWAHTTAEHATRNHHLRVFSSYGCADFINVLFQKPMVQEKPTKNDYVAALTLKKVRKKPNRKQLTAYLTNVHNINLVRTISVQHAMYLPWRLNGGIDATSEDPGFNAEANRQADKVYDEIRGLMPANPQVLEDEFTYEKGSRAYITGLTTGADNPKLSENFSYNEVYAFAHPMRLSVQLMKYIQLLRYRCRGAGIQCSMKPKAIFSAGDGLAIQVSPNTEKKRTDVLGKADEMVQKGLLITSAVLKDEWIYITVVPKHIYFSIYYKVPDNAYKRAAETWKQEVEKSSSYIEDHDVIIMKEVKTETDFKNAWKEIYKISTSVGGIVIEGHLFTEASKQLDGRDGLEFAVDKTGDSTLTKSEINSLDPLNWDVKNGLLFLHACNSGLIGARKWAPAQEFAKTQKVNTIGQAGFAYFSLDEMEYVKVTDERYKKIYLWAYDRGWAGGIKRLLGNGSRLDGIVYNKTGDQIYPPK